MKRHFVTFVLSFLFGICLALFREVLLSHSSRPLSQTVDPSDHKPDREYQAWLHDSEGLESFLVDPDIANYSPYFNGTKEAEYLKKRINVTCMILSEDPKWARAIKSTWGSHCASVFFFSSKISDSAIPITQIPNVKSSFDLLCKSMRRVGRDLNWLFISKEKTFAIIENLLYYLAPMNFRKPYYLGHARSFWGQKYNWQDPGYVLSRESLRKFFEVFSTDESCESGGKFWKNGDWYLAKHLQTMNITPIDTRDDLGRGRFNGYPLNRMLFPGGISPLDKYWKDSLYPSPDGPNCCSAFAVTFYGVPSDTRMYQMQYLFYSLRHFPAGGRFGNVPPSHKESFLTRNEKLKIEKQFEWLRAMTNKE